jgi:OOP family OmpA-OmpF porin
MLKPSTEFRMNKTEQSRAIILCGLWTVCSLTYFGSAWATNSGLYIGASVGQSEFQDIGELERACTTAGAVCKSDDSDTGFKALLGYQLGDYVALEGGYVNLGTLEAGVDAPVTAVATFEVQGGFLSVVPQVPIGDIGAIYGRFGLTVGDAKLTAQVPSEGFDESDSGTVAGVSFGVGGAINMGLTTIRVEWERYSFDEAFTIAGEDIDAPDVDLISGTVLVRFR